MKETEDSRHICPRCPYMHDPGVSPCTWAYFIVLHYCPAECFYMPYMCVWYVRGHLGRLPRYSSLSACYRESIGWRARVSPARPRLRVVLIRFWSRTTYQVRACPHWRNKRPITLGDRIITRNPTCRRVRRPLCLHKAGEVRNLHGHLPVQMVHQAQGRPAKLTPAARPAL